MKKFLSVILAVFLIFGILSGCSKESESKNDVPDSEPISLVFTTDEHNLTVSQSVVRAYEALCSAVLNGDNQASFNISLLNDVNRLFYSDFPLSYLVNKLEFTEDNSGVRIVYEKNADEHKKAVDEFKVSVNQILTDCGYGKVNNNVFVLNLYSYLTKNTMITSRSNYDYDVIVNSMGYSSSFAGAFAFLLNQAGVKASVVHSTNENGICYMTEAEFKGEKYIFNPFFEARDNEGKALCYFALDYNDLSAAGYSDVKYRNGDGVVFDDGSSDFADLRDSVSYSLDGNKLSVKTGSGSDFQIEL